MYNKIVSGLIISLLFFFSIEGVAKETATLQNYERFALVIGNKDYTNSPLINPVNDARAMKKFLVSRNFSVTYVENANLQMMESKIEEFIEHLRKAKKSVAFVYYSGHGRQEISRRYKEPTDYLIPINNQKIKTITALDYHSVSLNQLLSKLDEINHGLNIVLIDACRNKLPSFTKSMGRTTFIPIPAKGIFLAYATTSGTQAFDNSLFRKSFIKHASQPQRLTDIFSQVKRELNGTSQRPSIYDETVGDDFYFTGGAGDRLEVLEANYYRAKTYEEKSLLALEKGDTNANLTEYRKAWLYGLEAKKLRVPQGQAALKEQTLNQLTSLSADALNPEKYSMPAPLDIGSATYTLTYSPDGHILASGAEDGTIRFWDAKSGQLKQTFKAHSNSIYALSYNADGSVLASASEQVIKLWDTKSILRQPKQRLEGHNDLVEVLVYSPDGSILASGAWDHTVKLWDAKSGKLKKTLKGHKGPVEALSFNPNGRVLASASSDKTIKLWDVESGQLKQTLKGHDAWVYALSYSPNGRILASGSLDKTIKLWNAESGQLKQTLKGHKGLIKSLSYVFDGRVLASASSDKTIKLWDAKSGELKQTLKGHKGAVKALSYNTHDSVLASVASDKMIKLWDVKLGKLKQIVEGNERSTNVDAADYSQDDLTQSLKVIKPFKQMLKGHKAPIEALIYSPNGRVLASASRDNTIKLWDSTLSQLKQTLKGHEGSVYALSYRSDSRMLASASKDNTIKLWDTQSGQLKQTLKEDEENTELVRYRPNGTILCATGLGDNGRSIETISYSIDNTMLIAGSKNGMIKLWDVKSGQLKQTLKGHKSSVKALNTSPDGRMFASGSLDGTIKLWDVKSGRLMQTLKGHTDEVYVLSYSPDGRVLASGSKDNAIKLWDTQSGELKQTLRGHEDTVYALSYRPDGVVLASGSWDKTIKLWEIKSGDYQLKQTLKGHETSVLALSYSPDGNVLASATENGVIRLWTASMLKTQDLFYKYDPKQVSAALQFLWEMKLDDDGLTFVHSVRKPSLYPRQGRYYADTHFLSLLDYPDKEKTKTDQLIQWLENKQAY